MSRLLPVGLILHFLGIATPLQAQVKPMDIVPSGAVSGRLVCTAYNGQLGAGSNVIEWNEYRGLMQAFFDSDVIDVELLYDNAMLAANYEQARKNGVNFMLSGAKIFS